MKDKELISFTDKGIFCEEGNFYIDPLVPVDNALITHGHSDHARFGHKNYLCTTQTALILKHRLGKDIKTQTLDYRQELLHNGIRISFHSAGHVVGSAQIRLENKGKIYLISGDYKLEDDNVSTPFESVKCHVFVTESTFGLPIYDWKDQKQIFNEINQWWKENKSNGVTSILLCYSLGKAQRILYNINTEIGDVYCHGTIYNMNKVLIDSGLKIPHIQKVSKDLDKDHYKGSLILATSSSLGTPWIRKFYPYSIAKASGWMLVRGQKKRSGIDKGFAVSDHCDWKSLNKAVKMTQAEKVYVVHGYTQAYSKWLEENNIESYPIEYGRILEERED